ncbi:MAG: hypothetical protein AAGI23_06660, partial [Bacteroidota bacterium]
YSFWSRKRDRLLPQNESKGLEMANSSVEPSLSPSATQVKRVPHLLHTTTTAYHTFDAFALM